jgi:dienelactone hydrolase
MTRQQAEETADRLWQERQKVFETMYGPMWDQGVFTYNNWRMPVYIAVNGDKPADGRSLYISMHGGGDTSPAGNDEEWNNQKTLAPYVKEGVYVAPRAAVDAWDMWFQPHVDILFDMIIRTAVIKQDVNPDKVYILGYSAGGDGVYRLAPRMADHWAAAMMAAGHPGNSSPLNLRNIGFTIWMGENDSQYDRNKLAIEYGRRLDSLQTADPGGYRHSTNIVPGKGHWMDNADIQGLEWLAQFRRNPCPDRIVWRQEESNPRAFFYCLSVPPAEAKAGMEARVDKSGNTITILKNDYATLYINLNDRIVDLDKPVTVIRGGQQVFSGMVARKAERIALSIEERGDRDYIFSAALKVTANGVSAL